MQRARNILFIFAITGVIMACALGGATPPSGDNVATIVASTIQALTPASNGATATSEPTQAAQPTAAPQGIPVSYKNVSFVIPSGLASDAAPQTVPTTTEDNGGPWGVAPEHIEFRLDNYSVGPNSFGNITIGVYPAQAYADANAGANIGLQRLKGVLANPGASLTNSTLPQVPSFNAASMFSAQIKRIHFTDGDGVRSVTQYGQAVGPVVNNGTFYHFQGLTSDGKYYIIAVLPVQAPFLDPGTNMNHPNADLPAGGIPFPGNENMGNQQVYDTYFGAVTDKLNSTPDDQFNPSLGNLDALVQSFKVSP